MSTTPEHYNKPVTPWDLERHMESSGNAFVDARRTDAIEYAFRMKGDLLGDLRKARHCLDAAIVELEAEKVPDEIHHELEEAFKEYDKAKQELEKTKEAYSASQKP